MIIVKPVRLENIIHERLTMYAMKGETYSHAIGRLLDEHDNPKTTSLKDDSLEIDNKENTNNYSIKNMAKYITPIIDDTLYLNEALRELEGKSFSEFRSYVLSHPELSSEDKELLYKHANIKD